MLFNLRFFRASPPDAEPEPPPRGGFRAMAARVADAEFADAGAATPLHRPAPVGPADGAVLLRDVFTPTQPRALGPLFIGREWYLRRLVSAVEEERAHVVLFGDRGRGKTSLANAFAHLTAQAGYVVLRCSCGSSITFETLLRTLLADLPPHMIGPPAGPGGAPALLPDGPFGAAGLTDALRRLRNGHVIFIIDEFDRVQSDSLRVDLAEAIKNLSDTAAPVTFLILGVAQSLDDLLGRHPSIQRTVVGLHLAPMAPEEIRRMILAGAAAARIAFDDDVIAAVIRFARGMPYYAHLLCLYAGRAAAARGSADVTAADLTVAVNEVLMKQEPELGRSYAALTAADPAAADLLFAAATADADAHGRFAAAGPPPDALVEAGVLARTAAPDGPRFGFVQPALAHYVLFRQAARRGLLAQPSPAPEAAHG
jgi:type II secretory pathway predicted ATPase ExeA